MIEQTIERWHKVIAGGGELLDDLLDDDVVFYSPVVFTPQRGKDVTKLYLGAAGNTLGDGGSASSDNSKGKFRYTKEILSGNHAMLEFETEMEGKYVNGVDIITCNDEGRIVEFRVMIRPLQAIQTVHAQMGRMLEQMKARS
ncbi:MAG: nuclear transport factor 2 family protein [bacterium]|nr:nuclear transport factor 2 family protein [bacterium]MCP5065596.1 nuclear transport factor 2 family protein [bacterium]